MSNQPTLPSRTPDGRPICFKCEEPGHIRIHCPKRGFSAGINCTGCGGQGHVQDECPTWIKKQGNQTGYATVINDSTCFSGLFVDLQIDGDVVTLLVDTGSSISILHHSIRDKNPSLKSSSLNKMEFSAVTANGQPLDVMGSIMVNVTAGVLDMQHKFYVAGDINSDGILGLDLLSSLGASINLQDGTLDCREGVKIPLSKRRRNIEIARIVVQEDTTIPPNHEVVFPASIDLKYNPGEYEGFVEPNSTFSQKTGLLVGRVLANASKLQTPVRLLNPSTSEIKLYKGMHIGSFIPTQVPQTSRREEVVATVSSNLSHDWAHNLVQSSALTDEQKNQVEQLLEEFKSVFSQSSTDYGRTELIEHQIDTGAAHPIRQPPRRIPQHLRMNVDEQIDSMLDNGIIEPSRSPWSSPIVVVPKKDGGIRFCVDYRQLNSVTIKDAYPLPQISDTLESLAGAKFFSTLDLASGYWQVGMHPDDQHKTAFASHRGLFEFKVLPFGLCNAPATFERLMEFALAGLALPVWST